MNGRYMRIPSDAMGRDVHVWTYGWWGEPLLVFPTAAGFAHEWQSQGMVDTLGPLLRAGKIKLYCPESNVAEAWTREADPAWRIKRHLDYERFVIDTMVPFIREDCRQPNVGVATIGASLGAMYAANFVLKHPETFHWGLCLSGRYEVRNFTNGFDNADIYHNNPLAFVPNLGGADLERVRKNASLTLVCGTGAFEEGCIEETMALAHVMRRKGIEVERDIWGKESKHDWGWWKKQAVHHLGRRYLG